MRPRTILWFEWAWIASLVIGVVNLAMTWDEIVAADDLPVGVLLAVLVFTLALFLTLVLFVSRRRSRVAKWALVVLTLYGSLPFLSSLRTPLDSLRPLDVAITALELGGLILLFTPSARAWLAAPKTGPRTAEALERTFE